MERKELFEFFEQRFGIGRQEFEGLEFYEKSKGRVFAINKDAFDFLDKVKTVSAGLLFARKHATIKPSSNIIQIFGKRATRNILVIDKEQAKSYIRGFDLEVEDKGNCANGYVIVKYKDYPLGIGLLKENTLKNMLQKGKRINVEIL